MPTVPKKDYDAYQNLMELRRRGLLLSPDTIRFLCGAYSYDATKIGEHFLALLPRIDALDNNIPHYEA